MDQRRLLEINIQEIEKEIKEIRTIEKITKKQNITSAHVFKASGEERKDKIKIDNEIKERIIAQRNNFNDVFLDMKRL